MTVLGADVSGLDRAAHKCSSAAETADTIKNVMQAIVIALRASEWFTGPWAEKLAQILSNVVIPWLNRIAAALRLFAPVLSGNAQAQRQVSEGEPIDFSKVPTYPAPQLPAGTSTTPATNPVVTPMPGTSTPGSVTVPPAPPPPGEIRITVPAGETVDVTFTHAGTQPGASTPTTGIPSIPTTTIGTPTVSTPTISIPTTSIPTTSVPTTGITTTPGLTPSVGVPGVTVPSTTSPGVAMPSLPDQGGLTVPSGEIRISVPAGETVEVTIGATAGSGVPPVSTGIGTPATSTGTITTLPATFDTAPVAGTPSAPTPAAAGIAPSSGLMGGTDPIPAGGHGSGGGSGTGAGGMAPVHAAIPDTTTPDTTTPATTTPTTTPDGIATPANGRAGLTLVPPTNGGVGAGQVAALGATALGGGLLGGSGAYTASRKAQANKADGSQLLPPDPNEADRDRTTI